MGCGKREKGDRITAIVASAPNALERILRYILTLLKWYVAILTLQECVDFPAKLVAARRLPFGTLLAHECPIHDDAICADKGFGKVFCFSIGNHCQRALDKLISGDKLPVIAADQLASCFSVAVSDLIR